MDTKESILVETAKILAREGVAGTSMRKVAAAVGIEASVIYSHFSSKLALLRATRQYITMKLAREMALIPHDGTTMGRLRAMITFQMKSRDSIISLLQFFMVIREDFAPNAGGYVPSRAYQHVTEIISQGVDEGIFHSDDIEFDAKAINHMISGFLMEYFDHPLTDDELNALVNKMCQITSSVLINKQGVAV